MIADQYLQLRSELETALAGLLKLASEMRRPSWSLDNIQGLLTDIREPLLIVAVGEVKSGKSSLLNALFGEEFAKVDVLPATDRVCIFRYGDRENFIEVSPQLTERYLPVPFLRDFNVVDTPGTNTMVAEHQLITESFIPRADLVLFVFSVVNPWTQSAWDLLGFVQKKMAQECGLCSTTSRSQDIGRDRRNPSASSGHRNAKTGLCTANLRRFCAGRVARTEEQIK